MRSRRYLVPATLVLFAFLLAACDQSNPTPTAVDFPPPATIATGGEVTVFAASSLQDVFEQIKTTAEASDLSKVTYNFAGSQALVTQLSQGAKADVFASADEKTMIAAVNAGVVETGTYRSFASNKLVVIAAPGDKSKVKTLQDLATPGTKVVLAADAVPAGNYSLQVLDKLSADPTYGSDFKSKVMSNVVSREDNVRQVVTKVQLGEADAGIVYLTDAKSAGANNVTTIGIPDQYNVIAEYFVAVLKNAPNTAGGRLFIGHLFSDDGQTSLQDFGFSPPLPR